MAANDDTASKARDPLTDALARLNGALDGLDKAVDAAVERSAVVRSADEQVQRMADDRARLANDLDSATARAERLSSVNSEVSRRLVGAMETVRAVMDSSSSGGK
ncbi:MAG: DUF4164 domain-containing protein [Pseudomonadota bacterium]